MRDYSDIFPNIAGSNSESRDYSDLFPAPTKTVTPKAQEKPKPEDPGVLGAMAIGAGRTADQLVRGVRQLATNDPAELERLAQEEASNKEAYKGLQSIRPWATGFGEAIPYVATPGIGVMGTAALGAGIGGLKYGTPEEKIRNAAFEGVTGGVGAKLGQMLGNAIAPGRGLPLVNESRRQLLQTARDMGMRPRLSQVTGGRFARQVEDWAANTPGGIARMAEHEAGNVTALNRVAANAIGQQADDVGENVLAAASSELGAVFNEIRNLGKVQINGRQVNPIAITPSVGRAADDVLKSQSKLTDQFQNNEVIALAEQAKMLSKNMARIDGEAYQLNRSRLTDAAHSAYAAKDAVAGKAYEKLLNALDNAAETSLQNIGRGDLAQALREVRPMYGNLKMLEKGRVAAGGDVNPQWVATVARSQNPKAFREGGGGVMYDIGRVGEHMLPLRTGSQTYPRQTMNSPISAAIMAGPANAAARMTTSPYVTGYAQYLANNPTVRSGLGLLGEMVGRPSVYPVPELLFGAE